jgi:hypothetical protein
MGGLPILIDYSKIESSPYERKERKRRGIEREKREKE